MRERAFGWVQDAADYHKLRLTVECFDASTPTWNALVSGRVVELADDTVVRDRLLSALQRAPLELRYRELVGSGKNKHNSILRIALLGQRTNSAISAWAADNFVRWAHAFQLIEYLPATDSLRITSRGRQLLLTVRDSPEEGAIWQQALLEYPPACRVLSLLYESRSLPEPLLSKFQLGHELGFAGDKGFTSFAETMFVRELALALSTGDQAKIRANFEGDSDKYARQICSWLAGLPRPLVRSHEKEVSVDVGHGVVPIKVGAYEITSAGTSAMGSVRGTSSHHRTPKFVPVEMLATKSSGEDRNYLRLRRSVILQKILRRPHTLLDLVETLQSKGMAESEAVVRADLTGLAHMGLQILHVRDTWACSDRVIGLDVSTPVQLPLRSDVQAQVERLEAELIHVPLEYTALIAIGQDPRSSRDLEIKTMELLTEVCHWPGILMGGPNQPDGVAILNSDAIIVDTKAYAGPFTISADERRKMAQYVREAQTRNPAVNSTQWWLWIDAHATDDVQLRFLYVANAFALNLGDQLQRLSASVGNTPGAAITTENLLRFADQLLGGQISNQVASGLLSSLREIQLNG